MYRVYLLHETNVEEVPSGSIVNGRVTKEVNTADMFEFDWTGEGISFAINSLTTGAMVKDDDGDIIFGGRLISFDRDIYGIYHLEFEGALSYLNDYVVAPFKINNADGFSSSNRIKALYNYIADAYSKVASGMAFTWNYLQMHESFCELTDSKNLANVGTDEFISCLECFKTKLIDNIGATFDVVYEPYDDYFEPRLYVKSTFNITADMNGQSIELGQNIVDTKLTRDFSDLVTRIVPLGKKLDGKYGATGGRVNIKSVNNNKLHIDNATAQNNYGMICKQVVFDTITNENTLKSRGTSYLNEHCNPKYTIELTAIDLHQIDTSIQKFKVGRHVRVLIPTLGVDEWMLISKYEHDITSPENSKITIGDKVTKLSQMNLNVYYDMNENRQYADDMVSNATDGIMVNVTTAENEVITGTTLTGIVNGVEITATETADVNANNGDYFVKAQNGKLYKINFEDLEDELMVSILSTDFDKLVSGKNVIVDNLLASKIFAENITATGTINGATLVGAHAEIDSGRFGNMYIDDDGLSTDDGFSNHSKTFAVHKGGNLLQFEDVAPSTQPNYELIASNGFRFETDGRTELETGSLILNRTPFNELLKVKTKTSEVVSSIASQGTATITAPVNNEDGYTPIAVVGYQLLGASNQSSLHPYRLHLNGNNAEARVRNMHTSTAVSNAQVMFYVLYMKTIGE